MPKYLRGFNLADNTAIRSRLTTGGSSNSCSHPTGGEDGGDIRKFLSLLGASKKGREFLSFIGLVKKNLITNALS